MNNIANFKCDLGWILTQLLIHWLNILALFFIGYLILDSYEYFIFYSVGFLFFYAVLTYYQFRIPLVELNADVVSFNNLFEFGIKKIDFGSITSIDVSQNKITVSLSDEKPISLRLTGMSEKKRKEVLNLFAKINQRG